MPKGPSGQKRPADAIGAAIMVAKIGTMDFADLERDAVPGGNPPMPERR